MSRKKTNKEFIEEAKKVHGNKYNYSKVQYINNNTKIRIICDIHGEFEQLPSNHLKGRGCYKCRNLKISKSRKLTQEEFLNRVHKIHGDRYDYSESNYKDSKRKIYIICKIHGKFRQTANDHLAGKGCPKCGNVLISEKLSMGLDEFTSRANDIHESKYDYSKSVYESTREKICILCPIHGEFWQMPINHLRGHGCDKCARGESALRKFDTTESVIVKFKKVHGDTYDYSKVNYQASRINIHIICKKHGIFDQMPNNHLMGKGCPKCSPQVSIPEIELQNWLESKISIIKNDRSLISPKELDIIIPSKNLAIEFNGIHWHSELKGKDKKYHLNKTTSCSIKGLRLLHITDQEWINQKDIVKSRLNNILGLTTYKLYGRNCTIKSLSKGVKNRFLSKYHIQGVDNSSVRLGAFYKGRLISVMTFGKNRYGDSDNCYELIRYATISSFSCVGVAGKLLKYFERNYTCDKIKTYADLRWSEGGLYRALGFDHTHNSTPNYHYIKNGKIVGSRVKFQKHKLKDILPLFDSGKSEWENMKANGYDRIWDCGNMVFEKTH